MNLTIFGGTGETGILVIKKALEAEYRVTAFARNPAKISFQDKNLKIIKGELTDINQIENAMIGADVVISVLGPTGKTKGLNISTGIKNIISAMERNGVKRFIATATPSFKVPNDKFQFSFSLAIFMIKTLAKDAYCDIVATGEAVSNSQLDWTLVRIPTLSRKPGTGKLNIGYTGTDNVKVFSLSREDLADFLIKQINDKNYLKKAPVISN
ncbi:MAG: NAD(P)H-binding protein [Mariniphaga sp.]|nr:NAD(P)H-binding protein [Mariniphaga sp.]